MKKLGQRDIRTDPALTMPDWLKLSLSDLEIKGLLARSYRCNKYKNKLGLSWAKLRARRMNCIIFVLLLDMFQT